MPAKKRPWSFGERVMRLRKGKNMTLKNLANETGLSTTTLSQIEKGEVIAPVSMILQLSRALGIDSSVLLREEQEKTGRESALGYKKRTEDYTYQTLTPEAAHKHLKAFGVFIDPKSEHKGVSYQHQGEEFIYVLQGKIEVMVGENKNTLAPGESIHFDSSIMHKLRNISPEKAELLVVLYTP
jgi:transcriptional regulator with XRE-family HTH domain